MKVTLLHFSGPPTIGGVEQTLFHHARLLSDLQFEVSLAVGTGSPFDARVPVAVLPEAYSKSAHVLAVKSALDRGEIPAEFTTLRSQLVEQLSRVLKDQDVLIVHNALTLHKNLALTAALWELEQARQLPPLIGWHHDLAWDRPDYQDELHPGPPWALLRQPWPGAINVVVSRAQQTRLSRIYAVAADTIEVVPPGVDPQVFGRWSARTRRIVDSLDLRSADVLLLLPARITRRKNIEYGLRTLEALRRLTQMDCRLIVTGPPGAHNPTNITYLAELISLREELGLEDSAHFLFQLDQDTDGDIDPETLSDLYRLSDALFFPSHDEGFGIPLLEAGLARLPIFCSDIPPFHESGGADALFFDRKASPAQTARLITGELEKDRAFSFRRKILAEYTWDEIVRDRVVPILVRATGA